MKYKAVIFDLDGVLCSTDSYHYEAWKALADRLHIEFNKEINNRLRGVSRSESLDIIMEKCSIEYTEAEKALFAEEKNMIYRQLLEKMTAKDLSLKAEYTLQELKKRGILTAIGSSSKNTETILDRLGLSDYFNAIADGTKIKHSKPDPEVFLLAAELLGVEPSEALVIEDAYSGIAAAKAGGFTAAGIGAAADCPMTDHILHSLDEVLQIA